jgi:predicted nucleotidyltransferase
MPESTSTSDEIFDLEAAIKALCGEFPAISNVYIFGSRRYHTRSSRSDIDILLESTGPIKKSSLRDFILNTRTALDLFVLEEGKAESVANESYITAGSNKELITKLNAELLYSKGGGSSEFLESHKQQAIDRRVVFKLTVLPSTSSEYYEVHALQKFFRVAQEHGLPARPYIGTSTEEASEFIIGVIRSMTQANKQVSGHGSAAKGWTVRLNSEYDFQSLFWITVKPWLPGLSREEVAITYDGKEKKSDFSLFASQLILEFKHIKDDGDARETAKTLAGLSDFYQKHTNVRVILFVILVDGGVSLDDAKWESDYSFSTHQPKVKTIVVRNNI